MNKNVGTFLLIGIISLVVGFFAGIKYQQSKIPNFANVRGNGQFGQRMVGENGNSGGFRPVNGEIIAVDEKSITVKLQDGSSKIVLFSDNTSVNKASQATVTDLTTGEQVMVVGAQNSDGSVTAQSIQVGGFLRIGRDATPAPQN